MVVVVLTVGRDIGAGVVATHVTLLGDFSPLLVLGGFGNELLLVMTAVLLLALGLGGRGVVVVVEDVRMILTAAGTATGR